MTAISWWWSRTGPLTGYNDWGDEPLEILEGSALWLRLAIESGPEVDADYIHMNFVVPTEVEVAFFNQKDGTYERPIMGAENEQVGSPLHYEVKYFSRERRWIPHFVWHSFYLLIVPWPITGDVPLLCEATTKQEISSTRLLVVKEGQ
jgi:hypothetical protein